MEKQELIHNTRLLLFAEHLAGITNPLEMGLYNTYSICELDMGVSIEYEVICHSWVIEELLIFEDSWTYDDFGEPTLVGIEPGASAFAGLIDFFGMTPEEACCCFDLDGFQNSDLFPGCNILNKESSGLQIAQNILLVVRKRRGKI